MTKQRKQLFLKTSNNNLEALSGSTAIAKTIQFKFSFTGVEL